jgi:hypothetical protein
MISYNNLPGLQNTSGVYDPNTINGLLAFVAYESSSNQLLTNVHNLY